MQSCVVTYPYPISSEKYLKKSRAVKSASNQGDPRHYPQCHLRPSAMAGMPLFAHAGREKLTPPLLSAPLELTNFCGSEPRRTPGFVDLRCPGAAPGWFLPVLLRKTHKNARKAGLFSGFYFPRKTNSPPPGIASWQHPLVSASALGLVLLLFITGPWRGSWRKRTKSRCCFTSCLALGRATGLSFAEKQRNTQTRTKPLSSLDTGLSFCFAAFHANNNNLRPPGAY